MSISTRVSIAWPPDPPSENTDTLVLSFPSGYFIDLRFVAKNAGREGLDWGFAGRTVVQGEQTTFIHRVDTRYPKDPFDVRDSGHMTLLPNGDELETGEMAHPDTGELAIYEEIWRRVPNTVRRSDCVALLESADSEEGKIYMGFVGDWHQCVAVVGDQIYASRHHLEWNYIWEEVYAVGQLDTVIDVIQIEDTVDWKAGQEVYYWGRRWKVRDRYDMSSR